MDECRGYTTEEQKLIEEGRLLLNELMRTNKQICINCWTAIFLNALTTACYLTGASFEDYKEVMNLAMDDFKEQCKR